MKTEVKHLSLYLLGTPRLERDGKPVVVDTRKAIALVAYLAMTREGQSRDALATLLYPESDQTRGRAALRRTLSALKHALGEGWLDADRELVRINPAVELWTDLDAFHTYLGDCERARGEEGRSDFLPILEKAVALYRDDFMAGFTLRDSPAFDDWQFFQTEGLRREFISALRVLSRGYTSQGAFEKAIDHTRRWLALEPLDEPAHRQLMSLYAWSGHRAAALRQYHECERLLRNELDVAPVQETVQLYEMIEQDRAEPPRINGPSVYDGGQELISGRRIAGSRVNEPSLPEPLATVHYPLMGRSRELTTMLNAFRSIRGDGCLIVLEGEPGIGKTRLGEEFLAEVRAGGGRTVAARSYEGENNLAYGLFVEALQTLTRQAGVKEPLKRLPQFTLSEAARLVPDLGQVYPDAPPAPPLDSPGAQLRFFEAVSQLLIRLCSADSPGVLFLDDLQWADAASLDLLNYIARRLRGNPLCLLAAWRTEEVPSDHRLRRLVAETQRAGVGIIIRLPALTHSAVIELVGVAHAGATRELSERIWKETEGQPFYLVQYLVNLPPGNLPPDATSSLPGGVRDLLRAQLQRVSDTARQLLSAAAVIGRSFSVETLLEVSGRDESELVTALEELLARGMIVEVKTTGDGATLIHDFQHEKLRTFVYDELSLGRRRLLHRRVGEALVNQERLHRETGPLANQIAFHFQAAGREGEAAGYLKLAGDYARKLYANAKALEYYQTALALGHPDTASLQEAVGDMQTLAGEYGAALKSYQAALAHVGGTFTGRIEWKMANVYLRRGDWDLAETHFQEASNTHGTASPAERAQVYVDWSLAAHRNGRAEQAGALARQALELAQAQGDQRTLAQAHNILAILARHRDDLDEALVHLEPSMELAESLQDEGILSAALNNLALLSKDRGELERGIRLAERALALTQTQGDRHRAAALHNNLADLLHAAGRADDALEHLRQAVAIYAEMGVEAGVWQPEVWKLTEW